jgi:mannose-6-phosphate isomerase-like protein (cupin superfamily)
VAPAGPGPGLARRLITVAPRSRFEGTAGSGGELWYVISGSGLLDAGDRRGHPATVSRDTGVWMPPRAGYRLRADPDAGLALDAVALPAAEPGTAGAAAAAGPLRLSALSDCEVERTGDRRFRVLLGPGRGCEAATQFVGEIPPGRAPEHSHPYDEIVLVLEGEGVVHVRGGDRPLAPGARVHLPPGLPHCLENTGTGTLVVLGVFHPGGSPAVKQAPG